jgi:prevent-host-death family protein
MPKTVSSTEAKALFGTLLKWTAEQDDEVIVELYGKPMAVLMPYDEYEKIRQLREQERRRVALESLRALRARVQARNQDLSEAEAYRLAGFDERVIEEMTAEETPSPSEAA